MKLRSLDFFKKLPNDIETSSVSGGLFSILAIIVNFLAKILKLKTLIQIGFLLFFSEYRLFANEEITKEMIIDNDQTATTMVVNINFTFLRVPCLGNIFDFIWTNFITKRVEFGSRR